MVVKNYGSLFGHAKYRDYRDYWGSMGIMEKKMEAIILGLYTILVPFWVP